MSKVNTMGTLLRSAYDKQTRAAFAGVTYSVAWVLIIAL